MDPLFRRSVLASTAAVSGLLTATAAAAQAPGTPPQPNRGAGVGGTDPGPRNATRDEQNPDLLNPPATDSSTLPT